MSLGLKGGQEQEPESPSTWRHFLLSPVHGLGDDVSPSRLLLSGAWTFMVLEATLRNL